MFNKFVPFYKQIQFFQQKDNSILVIDLDSLELINVNNSSK